MAREADRLAEAFADNPDAGPALCSMGTMLAEASDLARARVTAWLSDDRASTREIHRRLSAAGIRISAATVSDHRTNKCRCVEASL